MNAIERLKERGYTVDVDDYEESMKYLDDEIPLSSAVRHAQCVVCKKVWVDVLNGEDTCSGCKP